MLFQLVSNTNRPAVTSILSIATDCCLITDAGGRQWQREHLVTQGMVVLLSVHTHKTNDSKCMLHIREKSEQYNSECMESQHIN